MSELKIGTLKVKKIEQEVRDKDGKITDKFILDIKNRKWKRIEKEEG